MANDELGNQVIKRYEALKAERSVWDAHWDEVAKFVMPRKDNVYGHAVPGEKRANRLFDTAAIQANDDLAAFLHGMLTNPQTIWFGLSTGDRRLDQIDKVNKWLFSSVEKMITVLNSSNFQVEILETYTDLGSIGTNTLRIEEDEEDVIRFYSQPVYAVQIDENRKGDVDVVTREYAWDRRKILQEFGENLDEDQKKELGEDPLMKHEIIHEVRPREDVEKKGRVGAQAMPFASIHVLKSTGTVLKESGFEEFPYAVPRWTKINKERFGRSPAMKVLADIKSINVMRKTILQGGQLRIAPPLQVPDAGFLAPIKMSPYSTNYYRKGSKDRIEPLFTGADPGLGIELLEYIKTSIDRAFYLDKLNVQLGDRATTVEVNQRRDEQLLVLGPILGRLDRELLKVIIDRTFGIMNRKGLFDEMPPELEDGVNLKIKYTSAIARAQLVVLSQNIVRAIGATGPVLEAQPEVMDNIDGDKLLRHNFDIYSVDPSILRSEKDVKTLRGIRQQAANQAAQQEQALAESESIKNIGSVDDREANPT